MYKQTFVKQETIVKNTNQLVCSISMPILYKPLLDFFELDSLHLQNPFYSELVSLSQLSVVISFVDGPLLIYISTTCFLILLLVIKAIG